MDSDNPSIPLENIQPSSYAEGLGPESVRPNNPEPWSPSPTDEEPFVVIDLEEPSLVTGVVIQGGGPDTEDFPKTFTVETSPDGVTWTPVSVGETPVVGCLVILNSVTLTNIYILLILMTLLMFGLWLHNISLKLGLGHIQ
jgi:hypothetical protein